MKLIVKDWKTWVIGTVALSLLSVVIVVIATLWFPNSEPFRVFRDEIGFNTYAEVGMVSEIQMIYWKGVGFSSSRYASFSVRLVGDEGELDVHVHMKRNSQKQWYIEELKPPLTEINPDDLQEE